MRMLEANLAELPAPLAATIEAATPRNDEVLTTARDGTPVNGLSRPRRPALFHSGYAPLREAERIADTAADAGYVVVMGMGMGYHVRAIAARGRRTLVVEPDTRLMRTALERVDFTDLLHSGTVSIARPDRLEREVSTRYVPAMHGGLGVVELTGRVTAEPEAFAACREAVEAVAERLRSDLAVQARFGLRWMRNTILNIPGASPQPLPQWGGEEVVVAAAGPSLADALPGLAAQDSRPIVAVDTALPVLISHGLQPDLVVSIDCQLATYHHYLTAGFPAVPVAAELSLTPSLFAGLPIRLPVRTDHPLHGLMSALGLDLPYLDARGGNVTQAAVDLAARLGAGAITVVGADFSYPDGETYPRGSYVHRLFASRASRFSPLAGNHYAFLLDRPGVHRDHDEPSRWVQPLLSTYADSFGRLVTDLPAEVTRVRGRGIALEIPAGGKAERPRSATGSAPATSPRVLLGRLLEAMATISQPSEFSRAMDDRYGGPVESALAARALLPALTQLRANDTASSFEELLARAVGLADAYVEAALARCDGE